MNRGYAKMDTSSMQNTAQKTDNPNKAPSSNGASWVNSVLTTHQIGWVSVFKITFCNDCPKQANVTLNIYASGYFQVVRTIPNPWTFVGNGLPWTFYQFTVPVVCGQN